jgi:hypothetical protein
VLTSADARADEGFGSEMVFGDNRERRRISIEDGDFPDMSVAKMWPAQNTGDTRKLPPLRFSFFAPDFVLKQRAIPSSSII